MPPVDVFDHPVSERASEVVTLGRPNNVSSIQIRIFRCVNSINAVSSVAATNSKNSAPVSLYELPIYFVPGLIRIAPCDLAKKLVNTEAERRVRSRSTRPKAFGETRPLLNESNGTFCRDISAPYRDSQ